MSAAAPGVWCRREARLGRITLGRPARINALTVGMLRAVDAALEVWESDAAVEVVVLDGAGDRGFCAGGDLTVVHASARDGTGDAVTLWREEYALDLRLAAYPKPVVALMDGVTMGGGLGLGVHADVRVVTERSVLAMPEVAIGLAPDVGAADFLTGAPGLLGHHLALTGARVGAADALALGLADHLVPAEGLAALVDTLQVDAPARAVAALTVDAGRAPLVESRDWVDACYGGTDAVGIVRRLRSRPEEAARAAAEAIANASPTAVAVTARALAEATAAPGLAACLVRDFRLCRRFLRHPDLLAGTAAVVAKQRPPRWFPARLEDVTADDVDRFFAPLDDDLELPADTGAHPGGHR
jgi:enoyl-CoA hydratase